MADKLLELDTSMDLWSRKVWGPQSPESDVLHWGATVVVA